MCNETVSIFVRLTERRGRRPSMRGLQSPQAGNERRRVAEKEAAARRATDAQILEDAERLIAAWNERQEERMPMLFSPTMGAAVAARYWFLWVSCPAGRTTNAIDLRTLDRHRDAAITSLICPVARAGRMHRSLSSCGYREQASPTKCARSTEGECWANERDQPLTILTSRLSAMPPAWRCVRDLNRRPIADFLRMLGSSHRLLGAIFWEDFST